MRLFIKTQIYVNFIRKIYIETCPVINSKSFLDENLLNGSSNSEGSKVAKFLDI